MALIDSKQLNPRLTGSFTLSGSLTGTAIIPPEAIDGQLGIFASTGSYQSTHNSLVITGSITSSAGFEGDGSGLTGILPSGINGQLGIFSSTGSIQSTHNDLVVTGSMSVNTAVTTSTAITTNNITTGYPTSNNWGTSLDGSYFNNFDNTTHVSEILRFMAGIISHSIDTSSPTPNTKTFASIDTIENSLGNTDTVDGYLPQSYDSSNATMKYLYTKRWVIDGGTIFSGVSSYHDNGNTYKIDFDSNSGGSTSINSTSDTELFGLGSLTSGGVTDFKVRVYATQSFSDTGSISTPTNTSNKYTTQSIYDITQDSFGTTSGVTLAKIDSANPAVIPAAYQDGKFVDVGGTSMKTLLRKYHATETSFTSVSSSGYYNFYGLKVGIATGSGDYTFKAGSSKNRFWAPIDQISTDIGTNSLTISHATQSYVSATSRSLSGAPYLINSTYHLSASVSGLFNPMYAASTTIVDDNISSVGVGSVSSTSGVDDLSTNGGTIQTANAVFSDTSHSPTVRGTSVVPTRTDVYKHNSIYTLAGSTGENINQTGVSDSTFTIGVRARNRASSQSTLATYTYNYHNAGTFGQPAGSGSLGVYQRAQGYDGGSLTGTSETFTGEDFRIQLLDNVTAFNGTAWVTTYAINQLGSYDLQVKPGYLVDPGGDYRYWYYEDYNDHGTYKYYIRRFQDGSARTSMTINTGKTLVNWNSTSTGTAVGLILKSGTSAGSNTSITNCRLYDPSATTSNLISAGVSTDNHINPFSSDIDLYGNTGGSISTTTYTVPMRNADGMYLDSSDNELYVIVRYKGDETPVTSIAVTFS
jgi:hypothetical protein|tara:strand:+ start:8815 stop:11247 length:2433 start_codon:yes stop_codon:yes gene_type:complete